MIAVIFEVTPAKDKKTDYLDHAAMLRPELEKIDGFISVERFQSLTDPDKILSLSFFRNEAAVTAWRNHEKHRITQAAGRNGIFKDYRLRIGQIIRDYTMLSNRDEAPVDSKEHHKS